MIDISQATLDVIEAIKENRTIGFKYGHETIREIKPTGFFGDFDGFEGTDEATESREFRRFRFDKVNEWIGTKDIRHELECALRLSRDITKEAKYLCYPIGDIKVKLSSLAEEHGLEDEMEVYLDSVSDITNDLESAFYACESVFTDKIRELEYAEEFREIELEEEA
jgi:hypothetical protein